MTRLGPASCIFLALAASAFPAAAADPATPSKSEKLDYNINWPSGLTLGEAHWVARNIGSAGAPVWDLDFSLDARIPGFAIINQYHATTTGDYCMDRFSRDVERGSAKNSETENVDHSGHTITRKTVNNGGGESTFAASDCPRDALGFLMLARHELLSGRIPPNQSVFLGAKYELRLSYLGSQKIHLGDRMVDADRVGADISGPSARQSLDIYFARDAARTPLLVRAPLGMGTFSMELVR